MVLGEVRMVGERTIYGKIGDLCAYACLALTLMALAGATLVRTRER